MKSLQIDMDYLLSTLVELLKVPSPSGYTDQVVRLTCEKLDELGVPYELTRRGAIRATLEGKAASPQRAIVAHLDTLGAMVKNLKPNGRLELVPVGSWSSRFAEGGRVSVLSEEVTHRGTVLPLKASGHTFNQEIDTQPVAWSNVEVRVDAAVSNAEDAARAGIAIGDFVAFDPMTEIHENGYINSRHLDNKAGVACLLAVAKSLKERELPIPVTSRLLFTISEEVGSGASSILHGEVAEMIAVDNATPAPGQNSSEYGVTIAMADSSGPFDYHLTKKVLGLCRSHDIPFQRDVFKYYRCDAASALEAGNDIRTALVCFGADGSHGYERTHADSLRSLSRLLALYLQSKATASRDKMELGPPKGLPAQPSQVTPEGPTHWPPDTDGN